MSLIKQPSEYKSVGRNKLAFHASVSDEFVSNGFTALCRPTAGIKVPVAV